MKLGFVSAILPEYTLDQVLSFAHGAGFSSVELMCWPPGKSERRYAGVSHIDVTEPLERRDRKGQGPGGDPPGIDLGTGVLPQSPGRGPDRGGRVRDAPPRRHRRRGGPGRRGGQHVRRPRPGALGRSELAAISRSLAPADRPRRGQGNQGRHRKLPDALHGRRVARRQEPGNDARDLAEDVSGHSQPQFRSESRSISFHLATDRLHCAVAEFKDRIFHVHAKDARIDRAALDQHGVLSYPNLWHTPKIPGLGDVRWGPFFGA